MMEHIREKGFINGQPLVDRGRRRGDPAGRHHMVARSIARSQSGLDRKEMAVVRRAAGPGLAGGGAGGGGGLVGLVLVALKLLALALWCFAYYKHRAAVKKLVGFDPREQNRAEGVIFWFHELRITRTELIKGYEENARRIPLRGLTAAVTKTDTVDITIKGPDTKFVYSMPYDVLAGFNPTRAAVRRPPELRSGLPRCTAESGAAEVADYVRWPGD
jgi:hypothetical protein